MSRRKLIETKQEFLVVCDNPACDYKVENVSKDPNENLTEEYVNVPCPKCGENLLTEDDHCRFVKVMRIIDFINKWFSWILFFVPESDRESETTTITTHKEVKIHKTN